jgi:hypothetical protein
VKPVGCSVHPLDQNRDILVSAIRDRIGELWEISSSLRRDRELAFYGSEDLTASEFYTLKDAETAFAQARTVVDAVTDALGAGPPPEYGRGLRPQAA